MTNVRWEGCLKGISSTSALMFPSRREKCHKVEHAFMCVCVYGHILRLTWLWLGSLRSSGKAFFAAPWKSSREARLKRGQKSKAQFLNPENWLFFMINMHSSCVTTFFPLKYRKRLHESPIKNDERSQQIGSHVLSIQQNIGENIAGKRHGKFPQPELMHWISTKHISHKVECHVVSSTDGRKTTWDQILQIQWEKSNTISWNKSKASCH